MSASREKKIRQDSGPSVRSAQEQEKAAAYRKKTIRYTIIGVVTAVLVAALLIWNSGVFQRFETAAQVGDTKYSVSDLSYFYQQAKYQTNQFYYAYGMTQYIPADTDVQEESSGKTWHDFYLEQALELMKESTALYDEAVKNGWTEANVAEQVKDEIDSVKSSASTSGYGYGGYLKAMYGKFMTTGSFEDILTRVIIASEYSNSYADGLSYSDDEIDAYYQENKDTLDTFEYSYLYFTPEDVPTKDADGNDIERTEDETANLKADALAAAKEKADNVLLDLDRGATPADLIAHGGDDLNSSADHESSLGSALTSSAFFEELCGMADGETALVENGESGYYALILHSRTLVQDPTVDTRHILINAEASTDADGNAAPPTDEAWAEAKEEAEKVLAEYNAGDKTEESFAKLADQYSDDGGSNTNGGLYEGVYPGQFVTEYNDWLYGGDARSAGDVELIQHPNDGSTQNYYGYHIAYYVGENDPVWKLSSVSALTDEDLKEWAEGLKSNYTATLESGSQYV